MPVLLATLSALATAIGLVVQRDPSRAAPADVRGRHLAGYLVRRPLWVTREIGAASVQVRAICRWAGRLD